MNGTDVLEAVRALCSSIVERRDAELVDLTLERGGGTVLRVLVDSAEGGISIDEITSISEEISRALDEDDPIDGHYTLEVASPGLERPLVKPADYLRFRGREIKLKTLEPIEGRRNFQGNVSTAGAETFVLDLGRDGVVEIPYSSVAGAKLVVDWDAVLKGNR